MHVTRINDGHRVDLVLDKVKSYARFSLYQISKIVDGVKIPLYRETFTVREIREIFNNGHKLKCWYEYIK
jgi:hypothetical protein